jgi:hypothetical protein
MHSVRTLQGTSHSKAAAAEAEVEAEAAAAQSTVLCEVVVQ